MKFEELEVGDEFICVSCDMRFRKTRNVIPSDYCIPIEEMESNCILLSNNHRCCLRPHCEVELVDSEDADE